MNSFERKWLPEKNRGILLIVSFFLLWNSFLFYGFIRDGGWFALVILSIFVQRKIGFRKFTLISISFSLTTALIVACAASLSFLFDRPFDRLSIVDKDGFGRFRANQKIEMVQPTGDIGAMSQGKGDFDVSEREIVFITDSLGFRNNKDYHGQEFLLVGDSFIAGMGTSQTDLISEYLLSDHGRDVYNLGHPSDISGYVHHIRIFNEKYPVENQPKAIIFLYEGNDFLVRSGINRSADVRKFKTFYKKRINKYKSFFRKTNFYRLTFILYAKAKHFSKKSTPTWQTFTLQGQKLAILNTEINMTKRESFNGSPYQEKLLGEVQDLVAGIVFIPTKYRTYYPMLKGAGDKALPHANWKYTKDLARQLNIPALDLTEALQTGSGKLLKEKKLTFWTDDTHWNGNGMKIAAESVESFLKDIEGTAVANE